MCKFFVRTNAIPRLAGKAMSAELSSFQYVTKMVPTVPGCALGARRAWSCSDRRGSVRDSATLTVFEHESSMTKLLPEHEVFLAEILNGPLLLLVEPAREQDSEGVEERVHAGQSTRSGLQTSAVPLPSTPRFRRESVRLASCQPRFD